MTNIRRTQEQRPEGHAAAHQDPRGVPEGGAAPHDGRGRLPGAARRALRHRPGDGLPRADAVRAGRHPDAQPLRDRQGGVRAQRGQAPRPPGVPGLRPGRGVLRRRDREAPARGRAGRAASSCRTTRWRCTRDCTKKNCELRAERKRPSRAAAVRQPLARRLLHRLAGGARRTPGRCRCRAAAGWCCAPPPRPARRGCGRHRPRSRPCAPARPGCPACSGS